MDIKELLAQNNRRKKERQVEYNPHTGVGSPIERIKIVLTPKEHFLIPCHMGRLEFVAAIIACGSLKKYASKNRLKYSEVLNTLLHLRLCYDFEFWAASCAHIQDKQSKKIVPFVMRKAQLKLYKVIVTQLFDNLPVRIILLKARQWGGSTFVQIFMAWIQIFHRKGWHSVIVADVEEQSRNIRAMYTRLAQYHPAEVFPVTFKNFEGSSKNRIMERRDGISYIGSMQKPDSLRSSDVMMAHLSEVGLWKETDGKRPEDMVQSIAGTVPLEPFSIIVMESTAKGVGSFFHREWQKSTKGESGYTPVFVAWFEIEMYSKEFGSELECREFALSLSQEERAYFALGATLESIHWYRTKKYTDSYDSWRMCCEFPSTEHEAFQSTGRRAHSPLYIHQMRKFCKEPLYKGDVFADAAYGKQSINQSLHFEECSGGDFWVWALPDEKCDDKKRYVVSMDIGGRTKDADWSVITVIDRYWLSTGGVEECIGTCRVHLDQDLAIWKAVQIAKLYSNALLVVEANSLNSKGSEGDHSLTILDEIKEVYRNLYCRTDPQKIVEGRAERYGFFTSRASKTDIVNQMNRRYREEGYIERDARALDEADCYEIKEDGTYGAVEGGHDDIYMSRAIGLKASDLMV